MALLGSIALVLSAFFGSYSNVLVKAYGGKIDPQVFAACQMIFGFVPLLAIGIPTEGTCERRAEQVGLTIRGFLPGIREMIADIDQWNQHQVGRQRLVALHIRLTTHEIEYVLHRGRNLFPFAFDLFANALQKAQALDVHTVYFESRMPGFEHWRQQQCAQAEAAHREPPSTDDLAEAYWQATRGIRCRR